MRLGRGLLALGTLAALTAAASPAHHDAMRHLRLTASNPAKDTVLSAAPARLELWFSEAPSLKLTRVSLTGPVGLVKLGKPSLAATDKAPVVVPVGGEMPAGAYTITWRTASDDGHPVKGTIPFRVK